MPPGPYYVYLTPLRLVIGAPRLQAYSPFTDMRSPRLQAYSPFTDMISAAPPDGPTALCRWPDSPLSTVLCSAHTHADGPTVL